MVSLPKLVPKIVVSLPKTTISSFHNARKNLHAHKRNDTDKNGVLKKKEYIPFFLTIRSIFHYSLSVTGRNILNPELKHPFIYFSNPRTSIPVIFFPLSNFLIQKYYHQIIIPNLNKKNSI